MTDITTTTNWKDNYPSIYYAFPDNTSKINGYPVAGYIDIDMYGDDKPTWIPDAKDMVAMTKDQWDNRLYVNQVIKDGVISTETPIISLTDQASSALSTARSYITNFYIMLGEAPSSDMISYQKALMAIINGTDTTSTTLPTKPDEMTKNGY